LLENHDKLNDEMTKLSNEVEAGAENGSPDLMVMIML